MQPCPLLVSSFLVDLSSGRALAMPDSEKCLTGDHRIRLVRSPELGHMSETTPVGNRYTGHENILSVSVQVASSVGRFRFPPILAEATFTGPGQQLVLWNCKCPP